jgi:ankyrin repeat protein
MTPSNGQLPPRPSLEQCRNQARDLLRAFRRRDPAAVQRVLARHPRFSDPAGGEARFTLNDAQLVIAREAGLPSWPRLKQQIERMTGPLRRRPFVRDVSYYNDRAHGLLSVHQTGQRRALELFRAYHPRFVEAADVEIRAAEVTLDDARLVHAREHGFLTWEAFIGHVAALARGEAAEPFMEAFEALQQGDAERLDALLRQHQDLVHAPGTNGNHLLHLAASLGKEELVDLLLDRGADVNAENNKGWTVLHGAAYSDPNCGGGVAVRFLRRFLAAGAGVDLSAHGDGGTPLVQALFWGNVPQAEILAEHGVVPLNLRVAAGLGREDLVRSLFTRDGCLKPRAGAHREFHRPHSGFPAWQPSDDPQEILDEALVWAAKSGRTNVMLLLLERGARIDADPYRGTPLIWAATKGRVETVEWLLDHGADVNRRATFGGPSHGQGISALHLAAQNGDLPVVRCLVERGADLTLRDDLYNSTPEGWADHFDRLATRNYLRERTR